MDEKKRCLECNEIISGRADKKFCSDQCRNSFNNKINYETNSTIRNISNILRKNRKILSEVSPEGKTKTKKERLLNKGFNFAYHTHSFTTQKGDLYKFCFDYGYLELAENMVFIVIDNNSAKN